MAATRLCIIRHGETDWNVERRLQGQLDTELNAQGRAQAAAAARGVAQHAFAARYSSDLKRAMQTADLLAAPIAAREKSVRAEPAEAQAAPPLGFGELSPNGGGLIRYCPKVIADVGLRERHYGVFQGRTAAELALEHPEAHARFLRRDPDYDFGCGETLRNFATRVGDWIAHIASRHCGHAVLLVTHGGVLDIVYRRVTGRDLSAPRDFAVPNAALNWIEIAGDDWRLIAWADRAHLERALEEAVE
jgi:2,3-bisphosphoglycerate-dependent phosphoglycerate mutase